MGYYNDHINTVAKRFKTYNLTLKQKIQKLIKYGWNEDEIKKILNIKDLNV